MNRPIKFRVWEPSKKIFLNSYKNQGLTFANATDEQMEEYGAYPLDQCIEFGFIVQQYTGLKDKNGKEICEGDIIQLEGASYKYEVVWNKWQWGIDSKGVVTDFIQGFTSAVEDRAIVIGNIFEKIN